MINLKETKSTFGWIFTFAGQKKFRIHWKCVSGYGWGSISDVSFLGDGKDS